MSAAADKKQGTAAVALDERRKPAARRRVPMAAEPRAANDSSLRGGERPAEGFYTNRPKLLAFYSAPRLVDLTADFADFTEGRSVFIRVIGVIRGESKNPDDWYYIRRGYK